MVAHEDLSAFRGDDETLEVVFPWSPLADQVPDQVYHLDEPMQVDYTNLKGSAPSKKSLSDWQLEILKLTDEELVSDLAPGSFLAPPSVSSQIDSYDVVKEVQGTGQTKPSTASTSTFGLTQGLLVQHKTVSVLAGIACTLTGLAKRSSSLALFGCVLVSAVQLVSLLKSDKSRSLLRIATGVTAAVVKVEGVFDNAIEDIRDAEISMRNFRAVQNFKPPVARVEASRVVAALDANPLISPERLLHCLPLRRKIRAAIDMYQTVLSHLGAQFVKFDCCICDLSLPVGSTASPEIHTLLLLQLVQDLRQVRQLRKRVFSLLVRSGDSDIGTIAGKQCQSCGRSKHVTLSDTQVTSLLVALPKKVSKTRHCLEQVSAEIVHNSDNHEEDEEKKFRTSSHPVAKKYSKLEYNVSELVSQLRSHVHHLSAQLLVIEQRMISSRQSGNSIDISNILDDVSAHWGQAVESGSVVMKNLATVVECGDDVDLITDQQETMKGDVDEPIDQPILDQDETFNPVQVPNQTQVYMALAQPCSRRDEQDAYEIEEMEPIPQNLYAELADAIDGRAGLLAPEKLQCDKEDLEILRAFDESSESVSTSNSTVPLLNIESTLPSQGFKLSELHSDLLKHHTKLMSAGDMFGDTSSEDENDSGDV